MSQETEDALVHLVMQRFATRGEYDAAVKGLEKKGARAAVEGSLDRHAKRRRAAGESGW